MLIKRVALVLACAAFTAATAFAQDSQESSFRNEAEPERESIIDVSLISIRATPGVDFTLQSPTRPLFSSLAYGADILGWLPLPSLPLIAPAIALDYTFVPIQAESSFSSIGLGLGLALVVDAGRFQLTASGTGGGYVSFMNRTALDTDGLAYPDQSGAAAYFSGGVDVAYLVTPYLSVGIGGMYHNMLGLYQGIRAHINATLNIYGLRENVLLRGIALPPVFPSLLQYYGENPVAVATVTNEERFPITNMQVEFFVPDYMSSPRVGSRLGGLAPGESTAVEFSAFFADRVLTLQEGTQLAAELTVRYELNGRERTVTTQETFRMHDRNALTWDDDRKAASFVSSRDPEIIRFASSVAGLVRRSGFSSVNPNLRLAMGMFEAISLYGLSYVIDPNTPNYIESSGDTSIVDFLQYPRQTFSYRGGDCDDLSILYTALLEAVGVPTAFVTIPGHIFSAFSLDMSTGEARKMLGEDTKFIDVDGQAWMPVEVTLVGRGFLEAWAVGAEQWHDNVAAGSVGFFPMSDNWSVFPPSGYPAEGSADQQITVDDPDESLGEAYTRELTFLVQQQVIPQVQRLRESLNTSRNPERILNRIGVLYAQYGLEQDAERAFQQALAVSNHPPAVVNLANLYYLKGDLQTALGYYEEAAQLLPDEPAVLLSLARVNHELDQFAQARFHFAQLQEVDPETSEEFSYLAGVDDGGTRAADVQLHRQRLIWVEEEQ